MRAIFTFSAASALFLALARAELDKPALTPDLDYLLEGNANSLPTVNSQIAAWPSGYIPKDCQDLGSGEGYNASEFEVYEVTYDDVQLFFKHNSHIDIMVTDICVVRRPLALLPAQGCRGRHRDGRRDVLETACESARLGMSSSPQAPCSLLHKKIKKEV
jgi:hypothetical protein